jgi:hypothetical protein
MSWVRALSSRFVVLAVPLLRARTLSLHRLLAIVRHALPKVACM